MKKTLLYCLCIIVVLIGGYFFVTYDPGLPNGYILVCNGEGLYSLKHESFGGGLSVSTWTSKNKAKSFAWLWYKGRSRGKDCVFDSDCYEWSECD